MSKLSGVEIEKIMAGVRHVLESGESKGAMVLVGRNCEGGSAFSMIVEGSVGSMQIIGAQQVLVSTLLRELGATGMHSSDESIPLPDDFAMQVN